MAIPGTPILYYGDEIGMGDNVFLGDRNGVRTPMQWSPDRNGGFSRAEPEQLALPMLMDAVYGYPVDQCRIAAPSAVFAAQLDAPAFESPLRSPDIRPRRPDPARSRQP